MNIPDKLYFKIGEVAKIADVKPYVLRYWETEFKSLSPLKSRSGQRLYRKRDVELILRIKELLYSQRFTIEGARRKIRDDDGSDTDDSARREELLEMRQVVEELIELTTTETPHEIAGPHTSH